MTSSHVLSRTTPVRTAAKVALALGLTAALGLTSCSAESAPVAPSPSPTTAEPSTAPATDPSATPDPGDGGAAATVVGSLQRLLDEAADQAS